MKPSELLALIKQGENSAVEFKEWPLRPEQLMRLFQQSGFFHFNLVPVPKTSPSDLNYSEISSFFAKYDVDFSGETNEGREALLRLIR